MRSLTLAKIASTRAGTLTEDRSGFSATVQGVPIRVRCAIVHGGHFGPTYAWSVRATTSARRPGRLALRPKHESDPAGLRVGEIDFDTCFRVEGDSRALARELLHHAARRALLAMGPWGEWTYADGELTFQWELRGADARPDEIELAIAAAVFIGQGELVPEGGYRGD